MSEDITFCSNSRCKNTKCERNQKNIKQHWLDHSYAMFTDCDYWGCASEDAKPSLDNLNDNL